MDEPCLPIYRDPNDRQTRTKGKDFDKRHINRFEYNWHENACIWVGPSGEFSKLDMVS